MIESNKEKTIFDLHNSSHLNSHDDQKSNNEKNASIKKNDSSLSSSLTTNQTKIRKVEDYSEIACSAKHSTNHFDTFALCPKNIKVSFTEKEEKIILVLRQHPIVYWKKVLTFIFFLILPIFFPQFPFFNFLTTNYFLAINLIWYLASFGFILENFLLWYFNVYIITDERCIDVDFDNLLNKRVSSTKIDTIQDFTVEKFGVSSLIFNYGTIFIQTAASKNEFDFINVVKPQSVAKLLNELILEEEKEKIEGRIK